MMHSKAILAVVAGFLVHSAYTTTGRTWTNWDCCKPSCAWKQNLNNGVSGTAKVCDKNNNKLNDGAAANSSCSGGPGYLCGDYAPVPTENSMSYGFAVMMNNNHCCKCYQLTWTGGNARGKSMVVQAINVGGVSGDVAQDDIIIITPGGGSGPNDAGCKNQYGSNWGDKNGGVWDGGECEDLPQNLQGGCYWRWNWARGDINGWNIDYKQVSCPARLTAISGCSAG